MEWYHGSSFDDFEVPGDQEVSDRLPSPQSWLKWGETTPEKLDLQNKCFIHDAQLNCGGFNFNCKVFNNEVETESCVRDEDRSEECLQQSDLSQYQPDYQLDGLGECEQMDDIFLSSLLQDTPEAENSHKSFHCSPELQSGVLSNRSEVLDSKSCSSDAHNRGSSKYLKTRAFSPSVGMGKAKGSSPQHTSCTEELDDWSEINEPPMSVLDYPEDDSSNTFFDEETTVEECVLLELEMAITQLTDKTRMSFRDALYRLANNSGLHSVMPDQGQDVSMEFTPWTCAEDQIRSEEQDKAELKTNTIDRAVANMMFNKMEESSDLTFIEEAAGSQSCSMDHEQMQQHLGDGEVPVLGQMYLQTRTNPSELMWRNPVENMVCLE